MDSEGKLHRNHETHSDFRWLVNLSTVGVFFSWATINLTYIFFCKAVPTLLRSLLMQTL